MRRLTPAVPLVWLLCACTSSDRSSILMPCGDPAPVLGQADPLAPGYIVRLKDGVDPQAETDRLQARCGFTARNVYQLTPGFSAPLDAEALDCVRCDPVVVSVSHDHVVYPT